jgi:hypothetical protein
LGPTTLLTGYRQTSCGVLVSTNSENGKIQVVVSKDVESTVELCLNKLSLKELSPLLRLAKENLDAKKSVDWTDIALKVNPVPLFFSFYL